jgi:hypothetical protein
MIAVDMAEEACEGRSAAGVRTEPVDRDAGELVNDAVERRHVGECLGALSLNMVFEAAPRVGSCRMPVALS